MHDSKELPLYIQRALGLAPHSQTSNLPNDALLNVTIFPDVPLPAPTGAPEAAEKPERKIMRTGDAGGAGLMFLPEDYNGPEDDT